MPRCASEQDTGQGLGWTPPDPFPARFETERLAVRTYGLDDVEALYEAVSTSREHLLPWLPWAKAEHADLTATTHFIAMQMMDLRNLAGLTKVIMGIFDKATGRLLGGTGVHGIYRDTACAETGYWVRADATGKGYCTEATAGVLSWALGAPGKGGLGLRRIIIYCSAENAASRRIPEKLGLRQEVEQREDYFVPGYGCTDRLGWGVMAGEWADRTAHT